MNESEDKTVPQERWPYNFLELPENATARDTALMWIAQGLTEWGNDTADTVAVLEDAVKELPEAHCPHDCDRCHDDMTEIEDGGCSCRNCRRDDPDVTPCTCVNCDGIDR